MINNFVVRIILSLINERSSYLICVITSFYPKYDDDKEGPWKNLQIIYFFWSIWATKAIQSTKKERGDSNLWPIAHNTSILTTRPRHPWFEPSNYIIALVNCCITLFLRCLCKHVNLSFKLLFIYLYYIREGGATVSSFELTILPPLPF